MRVIHDLPYRPKKGKFCNIAERPVNIGPGVLQMSIAKMKGKRAGHGTVAGVGPVARLCCRCPGCSQARPHRQLITLTVCRHVGLWPGPWSESGALSDRSCLVAMG